MRPGTWAPAGGDIGTESQGKVWIRRPQPNPTQPRSNQVPRAPAGCRGDGRGGDAVIGPCSPSPPPPPGGLSPTVSARRPAGPGAGRHRRRGGWTGSRNGPDLRRAQTGGVRGCQGGTGGCWHMACSDGRAALGATAGAAHGAPSLASCLSPLLEGRWGPSAGGRNTPRGAGESPGPCSCSCRLGDPATGGSTQGSSARAQGQLGTVLGAPGVGAVLGGTTPGCRPTATPGVPRWGALWGLHRAPGTAPGRSRGTQHAWGQPDPTAAWSPPRPIPSVPPGTSRCCVWGHPAASHAAPRRTCSAPGAPSCASTTSPGCPHFQSVPCDSHDGEMPSCHHVLPPLGSRAGDTIGCPLPLCFSRTAGQEGASSTRKPEPGDKSVLAGRMGLGARSHLPHAPTGGSGEGVALGDSSGGGRGQRNSDRVRTQRTQQQSFGALPRDTATLLGTQPSSWGHCHLPQGIATFLGTLPLS